MFQRRSLPQEFRGSFTLAGALACTLVRQGLAQKAVGGRIRLNAGLRLHRGHVPGETFGAHQIFTNLFLGIGRTLTRHRVDREGYQPQSPLNSRITLYVDPTMEDATQTMATLQQIFRTWPSVTIAHEPH